MKINIVRQISTCLRHSRTLGLAAALVLLCFISPASRALDVAYTISPDDAALIQVFDDGRRTYLVFSKEMATTDLRELAPVVKGTRDGKTYFTNLNLSTGYPSIVGTYEQIVLTLGEQKATATYVGNRISTRSPPAEASRPDVAKTTPNPGRGEVGDPAPEESAAPASRGSDVD